MISLKKYVYRLRGEVDTKSLVKLGLTIGANFKRNEHCIIDQSHCWLIKIGDNVPLGVFMPYLLFEKHKKTSVVITVLLAFILSVVVERTQYVYLLGRTETDDIIFNILGACFGLLGYCFLGYFAKELENIKNKFSIWFRQIKSKQQVK